MDGVLWKPRYSPRKHPFGSVEDVTPSTLSGAPLVRTQGAYRVVVADGGQNYMRFNLSEDGGETFTSSFHEFPIGYTFDRMDIASLPLGTFYVTALKQDGSGIYVLRSDDGQSWQTIHDVDISEGTIGSGNPQFEVLTERASIFPFDGHVRIVVGARRIDGEFGTADKSYLVLIDNGDITDVLEKPPVENGLQTITSHLMNEMHGIGFFSFAINFVGGDEIWRVDDNGFSLATTLPSDSGLVGAMVYVPKQDTLLVSADRAFRLESLGTQVTEFDRNLFIQGASFATPGRNVIYQDGETGEVKRSEAFWDDYLGADEYGSFMNAMESVFPYSLRNIHPLKVWRRRSKVLLITEGDSGE